MPHSALTWRTFRLSLVALTLALGHAAQASGKSGVNAYRGTPAAARPAGGGAGGGSRTPARFVGTGPSAVAVFTNSGSSAGSKVATFKTDAVTTRVARAATPALRPPVARTASRPSSGAVPPAAPRDQASDARRRIEQAQALRASSTPAAVPAKAQDRSRRASLVNAALSRRPSGGTIERDPFGSVAPTLAFTR